MHDVFISYSHKDAAIADAICHKFEAEGIRCWYAPRNIAPGDEWADAIIKALDTAKVMILVFTDYSNASVQVHREVDAAVGSGKAIIPFKCSETTPTGSMKYYLSTLHWLDAMNASQEEAIGRLLAHTKGLLSGESTANQTVPFSQPDSSKPPSSKGKTQKKPVLFGVITAVAVVIIVALILANQNKKSKEAEASVSETSAQEIVQEGSAQDSIPETTAQSEPEKDPASEEAEIAEAQEPENTESQESKSSDSQEAETAESQETEDSEAQETLIPEENQESEEQTVSAETEEASAPADSDDTGEASESKDTTSPGMEDYLYTVVTNKGVQGIRLDVYFGEEKPVIEIPAMAEGLPVLRIGEKCFEGFETIEEVILPETMQYLEYRCFYGCKNLTRINFPEALYGWGGWVFAHTGFTNIEVPENFETLGYGSFYGCPNLETVVLTEKVKEIDADTFRVSPLRSVTIPSADIDIDAKAFDKNDDVTIIGIAGSYAERYAKGMGLGFEEYQKD